MTPDEQDKAQRIRAIYALCLILGVIPLCIWEGYAASRVWAWLVMPTVDGVPMIPTAAWVGVALLLQTFKIFKPDDVELGQLLFKSIALPPLVMWIAWVAAWWLGVGS